MTVVFVLPDLNFVPLSFSFANQSHISTALTALRGSFGLVQLACACVRAGGRAGVSATLEVGRLLHTCRAAAPELPLCVGEAAPSRGGSDRGADRVCGATQR